MPAWNDRPFRVPRSVAVLIGLLTIWPPVYFVYFFANFFRPISAPQTSGAAAINDFIYRLLIPHLATMAISAGLLAFFIVHVFKNPLFTYQRRILWVLVLFLGSIVAMPVYWFLFVWRQPQPSIAVPPLPPQPPVGAA